MSVFLLPQPQKMRVIAEKLPNSIKNLKAVISCKKLDQRLKICADDIFPAVDMLTSSEDCYTLQAGGKFDIPVPPSNKEGYALITTEKGIVISSISAQGLFYGMQTLKQLCALEEFPSVEIFDWPDLAFRSEYFDLRTIYPTFDRLLHFVRELASYKFNAVLVEFENKIPFRKMKKIRSPEAFTEAQMEELQRVARENYIQIVPVQQSFGHLEYVLTFPEFRYLRETEDTPGEMCPLRSGAFELAAELLSDTASLNPDSQYLSMGCDEVWSLGSSPECKSSGLNREEIALNFINRLAAHVVSFGKTPIVWHDMLEKATQEQLNRLNKNLVVGVWMYDHLKVLKDAADFLDRLEQAGIRYFVCSACRSYDSRPWQSYASSLTRLRNVDAWLHVTKNRHPIGLIDTNWAASFSFGRPYGLYETSRYESIYAGARIWNAEADIKDYLEKFMWLYHGVHIDITNMDEDRRYDYVRVVSAYLQEVRKNFESAQMMALGLAYDNAAPVLASAYRGYMFQGSEVEYACLKERAEKDFQEMEDVLKNTRDVVSKLVSEGMCEQYMASRRHPYEILRDDLRNVLERKKYEST